MPLRAISRACSEQARSVPTISAVSGMTLLVVPAWTLPQVTMMGSKASKRRVAMVCSARPISKATGMGSTAWCGMEAWPPLPLMVIVQVSAEAIAVPGRADDRAGAEIGNYMECEGGIGFRIGVEQPVLDHPERAVMAFLARLEHELDGAGELVAPAVKDMRGLHQHGGVRIMAAGMHAAFELARKCEAGLFRHGQRIHVAAQEDGAAALRSGLRAGQRHDQPGGRGPAGDPTSSPSSASTTAAVVSGRSSPSSGCCVDAPPQGNRGWQRRFGFRQ